MNKLRSLLVDDAKHYGESNESTAFIGQNGSIYRAPGIPNQGKGSDVNFTPALLLAYGSYFSGDFLNYGPPAVLVHTHNVPSSFSTDRFSGIQPYSFSEADLSKTKIWPSIIVTSDGLVLYAPKNWNSATPHGNFDFQGRYHRIRFDENGYEYSELESTNNIPYEK